MMMDDSGKSGWCYLGLNWIVVGEEEEEEPNSVNQRVDRNVVRLSKIRVSLLESLP